MWLALLVALATLLGGAPALAAPAAEPPTKLPSVLKVGTEGVYPPFSFKKGKQLTGFDVDVMKAVGKKLGVKVQFVTVQWDSMFEALRSGRIDMVANQVTTSPERKRLYDLSTPYVNSTGVVVVAEDNTDIKGLSDIKGKRAAENLTSNWKDVAEKNGAKIVGVDAVDKALQNLRQGSVDVIVNDKLAITSAIKELGDGAGVKIVGETPDRSQSVLAARKGSGYMPKVNQAIEELRSDGTLKRLYGTYFSAPAKQPKSDWDLVRETAGPMALAAIKVTIPLTLISFALGLVIGLGVAIARMSKNAFPSGAARLYISVLRGVPVLVLLMLIYFGMPQFGLKLPAFVAAVIGLTLNVSAYIAETIRSAVEAVPRGQWEAAQTVGMGYRSTMRRIVVPQAARTAVPPLSNTLIGLLKDTSLVSVIAVAELFREAQFAAAPTFKFAALYALAALYYWIIVLLMTAVQGRVETRVSRFVS